MIAALLWGSCGAPVGDVWELEPLTPQQGEEGGQTTVDLPAGITGGAVHDEGTGLFIEVPDGWRAWPGTPESLTRLHLEHAMTGASVQVHRGGSRQDWPARPGCSWSDEVEGLSSGLKHRGVVETAVCWPEVPGDSRILAWRLRDYEEVWLIEVRVPGGSAGLVEEALDTLMPNLAFE
ncbi:MAG: hypothetical protein VXW32_03170 [Myxococcota bacterium]|nr:hypothetical protein [Myxococcota bacterium]